MSLSIIESKHPLNLIGLLLLMMVPMMAYAQGKVVINSSFKLHGITGYELKNIYQGVESIDQINIKLGADYYILKNIFIGALLSKEKLNIEFTKVRDEINFVGAGLTAGMTFTISPRFQFSSRLIYLVEKGTEKYSYLNQWYSLGTLKYSQYDEMLRKQLFLSPELIYTPGRNIGIFIRIEGLVFAQKRIDQETFNSLSFNTSIFYSNLGVSYTILK